jgi:hypothetical protein
VAKSRQLIADALIQRGGSATGNTGLLEDAVQEPADSRALSHSAPSSSYDVFWWRAVVWSDKAAQVSFEAAKLDSSKRTHLLGFWFDLPG